MNPRRISALCWALAIVMLTGCTTPADFVVLDAHNKRPITRARVRVEPRTKFLAYHDADWTDLNGRATVRLEHEPYSAIHVSAPGYQEAAVDVPGPGFPAPDREYRVTISPSPTWSEPGGPTFTLELEYAARPSVLVALPDRFRGVLAIRTRLDSLPLNQHPKPWTFVSHPNAGGYVEVPQWFDQFDGRVRVELVDERGHPIAWDAQSALTRPDAYMDEIGGTDLHWIGAGYEHWRVEPLFSRQGETWKDPTDAEFAYLVGEAAKQSARPLDIPSLETLHAQWKLDNSDNAK